MTVIIVFNFPNPEGNGKLKRYKFKCKAKIQAISIWEEAGNPSPTPDVSVLTFAYLVQPVSDRLEKKNVLNVLL